MNERAFLQQVLKDCEILNGWSTKLESDLNREEMLQLNILMTKAFISKMKRNIANYEHYTKISIGEQDDIQNS